MKTIQLLIFISLFDWCGLAAEDCYDLTDTITTESGRIRNNILERRLIVFHNLTKQALRVNQVFHYDEGFFKIYNIGDSAIIQYHEGLLNTEHLADMPCDSLIYEYKFGDNFYSRSFVKDGYYYRVDKYKPYDITITYFGVNQKYYRRAEDILNSIEFIYINPPKQ